MLIYYHSQLTKDIFWATVCWKIVEDGLLNPRIPSLQKLAAELEELVEEVVIEWVVLKISDNVQDHFGCILLIKKILLLLQVTYHK